MKQRLAITTEGAVVRMVVNGTIVAELARADVQPDGVVGFRVDAGLDVHVTTLSLGERNVAPVPASR